MILNDFKWDLKRLTHEGEKSRDEIAKELGVTPKMLYHYSYHVSITGKYVEICELLGYDIRLEYIKGSSDSNLRECLAGLIEREGRTQSDIAREMGISQQRVSYAMNGSITSGFLSVAHAAGYGIKAEFIERACPEAKS